MLKDKLELLEERLVAKGLITSELLRKAKEEAERSDISVDKAIMKLGLLKEADIVSTLAEIINVPYVDLESYIIDPSVVKLVPESVAKRFKLIPLFRIHNTLTIAMLDPQDIVAIDEVRLRSGCEVIEPVMATRSAIEAAIDQHYGITGSFEQVVKDIAETKVEEISEEEVEVRSLEEMAKEAPVIKLVNLIFVQAIKDKASDIHVEPDEKLMRVRYRIDGILHETNTIPKDLASAVISRIKILSKMDIAERRLPQDGRIQLRIENRELDIRVSTLPTVYGENVVMRVLDKSSVILGLERLGLGEDNMEKFNRLIRRPYGIILVTGPTGSGKTTTLYSALSTINSAEKNIITIEDPVEYQIPLVRQTQINPKTGLTFAAGLRSILRQDPDIIMVGEIRDKETAEIAIQAALTGHLVFSTLHTNDAPSAVARLVDMGVEPFLVSSAIIGIIAQRLVRVVCEFCKERYTPDPYTLKSLGIKETDKAVLFRGKKCRHCKNTGYKGRTAIFEILVMNDKIRELILQRASANVIKQQAVKMGMATLKQSGVKKALAGLTTIEEVLRVTEED